VNDHQARQHQQQADARRFLQALSAGQVHVFDRFQNLIEPGCKVVYQPPEAPLCDVISVQPVLDPNLPTGLLDVTMTTTLKVRTRGNMAMTGAIVVGPPPEDRQPATAQTTVPAGSLAKDPPAEEPDPPMESPTDHAGQIKLVE
jgi:hypothetical protein